MINSGAFIAFTLGVIFVIIFCLYAAKHPDDKDSKK